MGKYLNVIIAIVILVIVTAVCSTFFYKQGQKNAWALSQQLLPLHEGSIYLCVEEVGANGVSFLTVKELHQAVNDGTLSQQELKLRMKIALNGMSLKEYNAKYGTGKR
jgi:hypothetical protein